MSRKSDNQNFIMGVLLSVLLLAGGFAVYGLVKLGVTELLLLVGIAQEVYQYITIIFMAVIIFTLTGLSFRKSIKKLLG